MPVYRLGSIIRMKREALKLTREKLCELSGDICSPQTLYRIEYGKVKVKQKVYCKLMESMEELPERNYSSIIVSKYQYLNLKTQIQMHIFHQEYQQAEEKLLQLETVMNPDYIRNKQYLMNRKATLAYEQEKITPEEYQKILYDALRCTIPNLDKIDIADWPYNEEEYSILLHIVGTYHAMNYKEKELEILLKMKTSIEKHYMDEDFYVTWHVQVLVCLADYMYAANQYEKVIEYCEKGIEESKKQNLIGSIHHLLRYMALSMEQQIQKEILPEKEREFCKKLLVQAYYLNISQKENFKSKRIKRLCETLYPGEIKLF